MFLSFFTLLGFFHLGFVQPKDLIAPIPQNQLVKNQPIVAEKTVEILASQTLDLSNRDKNPFINQVFKYNILLAVHNLGNFVLNPGEAFAFHNNILPEYQDKVVQTIASEFNAKEGYQSAGGIIGDGVCHLASFLNWVSSEANLETEARVNHDFRPIPGIPREYWTSIRYSQQGHNSQNQNLYIKNSLNFPVEFKFTLTGDSLEIKIIRV